MKCVLAPTPYNQLCTILGGISGPLSDRGSGPRQTSITSAMVSRMPPPSIRMAARIATYSRVNSSMGVIGLSLRPALVWVSTKS